MTEIQEYRTQIPISELTNLIHRSYRQLADLGFKYWGTHQSNEDTTKRISNGECFVVFKNGKLVGTVVLNSPENSSSQQLYKPANVTSFHQFAIDPDFQKQGIGSKMMDFVEQRAKTLGMAKLLCDTAEGAIHLIKMYLSRGYEIVDRVDWSGTNYISVIMSKELN
jgi:GNAT superfamily N-acetyltransferase